MTEQETDYLASAGFVCLGVARLYFQQVYNQIARNIENDAKTRADYKALKARNPAQARQVIEQARRSLFTQDQRLRYKATQQHLGLLMRDFEWVESYALLGHLNTKLQACQVVDIFDAYMKESNDAARLFLLWADFIDNDGDCVKLESQIKLQTKRQEVGHLAELFRMQ